MGTASRSAGIIVHVAIWGMAMALATPLAKAGITKSGRQQPQLELLLLRRPGSVTERFTLPDPPRRFEYTEGGLTVAIPVTDIVFVNFAKRETLLRNGRRIHSVPLDGAEVVRRHEVKKDVAGYEIKRTVEERVRLGSSVLGVALTSEGVAKLRRDIASPLIRVTADVPGARLSVNGEDYGPCPAEVTYLPAGHYRLEVTAPVKSSRVPWRGEIELNLDATAEIRAHLEPGVIVNYGLANMRDKDKIAFSVTARIAAGGVVWVESEVAASSYSYGANHPPSSSKCVGGYLVVPPGRVTASFTTHGTDSVLGNRYQDYEAVLGHELRIKACVTRENAVSWQR